MTHLTYQDSINAAPIGAATEDGDGQRLMKIDVATWLFTDPDRGDQLLTADEASDVLENVFPGSFNSPESR